ncbi:Uncharacterised protein [uncultured archaeon]|nr:Uncharacterised protein [uncultured archaeon]
METTIFEPRELGIQESKRPLFKQLTEDKFSPFYGRPLKEVFMCAFALGYKRSKKEEVIKRKADIRFESLSEQQKWILISVAIKAMGDITLLTEEEKQRRIWEIAEQYANGGIKLLHDIVYQSGYEGLGTKLLEDELRGELKTLEKK